MNSTSNLHTGYALPFKVVVPRQKGFFCRDQVDVFVSLNKVESQSIRRLERAFSVFVALANTGAFCGAGINHNNPSEVQLCMEKLDELLFKYTFNRCNFDDRAIIALVHLLLTQHKWLSTKRLSVSVENIMDYVEIQQDINEISTYPTHYSPLPFRLIDEQPEGQAVTFVVEFDQTPSTTSLELLDKNFAIWSDAILRGAYSLAPFSPEDSHVESYDDSFVVVKNVADRSFHKIEADNSVIDAALNILTSMHFHGNKINSVTIT